MAINYCTVTNITLIVASLFALAAFGGRHLARHRKRRIETYKVVLTLLPLSPFAVGSYLGEPT